MKRCAAPSALRNAVPQLQRRFVCADLLLALWQDLVRALLGVHEHPGHALARLEESFRMMSGLWGAGRSDRARGGRDCDPSMVGAHGAGVPERWFAADCARRRSLLHGALLVVCFIIYVGAISVKDLVPRRSFFILKPPCNT